MKIEGFGRLECFDVSHPQKKDVGKALKPPRCSIGFLHLRTLTSFQRVGQASFSLFRRTLQSRKRYRHFALQLSLPILQHLIDISQTVRQSRPHCAEVPRTRPSPSAPCCRKKKVSRPCNDRTEEWSDPRIARLSSLPTLSCYEKVVVLRHVVLNPSAAAAPRQEASTDRRRGQSLVRLWCLVGIHEIRGEAPTRLSP